MKNIVYERSINNSGKKVLSINHKLFYSIMSMSCLYLFANPILKCIGQVSIICIFMLCINDLLLRNQKIKLNDLWICFFVFLSYSIIFLMRNLTINAVYSCTLQVIILIPICLYSSITLEKKSIDNIFKGGKILYFILLIPAIIIVFHGKNNTVTMFNEYFSLAIYKIMFPCTFFFIAKSKIKLFKIIIFSFIFLAIGERTAFLCLYIIYITYIFLGHFKYFKFICRSFFKFFCLCIIMFPYIYVKLQYTSLGHWLNSISIQYTGGNFFSGRNRIWEVALEYFLKSPFFGYGFDNNILASNEIFLSTHSTYIYLLLQGGIIGLIIFLLFMCSIWNNYLNGLNDDIVRMSAAYFIGIMVLACFELTLIINSITISLFLWLVIGIGFIQKNNKSSIFKIQ